MELNFLKLQNGSDIRGVALEGVEGESVNFTPLAAQRIAIAFAQVLAKKANKPIETLKISIGNDSRITAGVLKEGIFSGLSFVGCAVYDASLASTPAMFMSTVFPEYEMDGAIMLTASHLPFNRNGMKFFDKNGGFEKQDIKEILQKAQAVADAIPLCSQDVAPKISLMKAYATFLQDKIKQGVHDKTSYDQPLAGMRIVVDAGNGAGGFFAHDVLEPLGADVTGSQFLEPDGMFPNHIPNPEDDEAMAAISQAVLAQGADLGLIFDTDVDRAAAVDRYGRAINRNGIIALMSVIVSQEHPGTIIVTDSVTSDKLTSFLEDELRLKHCRFKRGYKNIINEAIRLNNEGQACELAIETSGHCAMKENYFLDDGAYATVKILIQAAKLRKEGRTIDSLIAELKEARERAELRIKIKEVDFKAYGEAVLHGFEQYCKEMPGYEVANDSFEGVRVTFNDDAAVGWVLIRMSLHDPLLPINIEADNEGGVLAIKQRMASFLKQYPSLDMTPFEMV